jgi:hypothetical protein
VHPAEHRNRGHAIVAGAASAADVDGSGLDSRSLVRV